ncbi:hypothetical protein PR048_033556 [Dryococelus australis]|uniref:Uncharacterized protein n=1 Tax=Dryococelus australis TaxID=614101 RepID=A0ABQ9G0L5_9NEOP|nr:hypothetical protein PR048_033556 [Dryococelus australis]
MNAVKYIVVPGVVWTNRTMVSSQTEPVFFAVVDIGDSLLIFLEYQYVKCVQTSMQRVPISFSFHLNRHTLPPAHHSIPPYPAFPPPPPPQLQSDSEHGLQTANVCGLVSPITFSTDMLPGAAGYFQRQRSPCSYGRAEASTDDIGENFNDLQARLYSLVYKYADVNCTLVVCCHCGRRRLGQRCTGGVKHRVDQWLKPLLRHNITGARDYLHNLRLGGGFLVAPRTSCARSVMQDFDFYALHGVTERKLLNYPGFRYDTPRYIFIKAVHDKVSTFEINLINKSLLLPTHILTGALSEMRAVKLVTMNENCSLPLAERDILGCIMCPCCEFGHSPSLEDYTEGTTRHIRAVKFATSFAKNQARPLKAGMQPTGKGKRRDDKANEVAVFNCVNRRGNFATRKKISVTSMTPKLSCWRKSNSMLGHGYLFYAASEITLPHNLFYARLHHRGLKLDPRSDLRSKQKTVAQFEFRTGLEIEMKFISNRRNSRFEFSIRDQQPSMGKLPTLPFPNRKSESAPELSTLPPCLSTSEAMQCVCAGLCVMKSVFEGRSLLKKQGGKERKQDGPLKNVVCLELRGPALFPTSPPSHFPTRALAIAASIHTTVMYPGPSALPPPPPGFSTTTRGSKEALGRPRNRRKVLLRAPFAESTLELASCHADKKKKKTPTRHRTMPQGKYTSGDGALYLEVYALYTRAVVTLLQTFQQLNGGKVSVESLAEARYRRQDCTPVSSVVCATLVPADLFVPRALALLCLRSVLLFGRCIQHRAEVANSRNIEEVWGGGGGERTEDNFLEVINYDPLVAAILKCETWKQHEGSRGVLASLAACYVFFSSRTAGTLGPRSLGSPPLPAPSTTTLLPPFSKVVTHPWGATTLVVQLEIQSRLIGVEFTLFTEVVGVVEFLTSTGTLFHARAVAVKESEAVKESTSFFREFIRRRELTIVLLVHTTPDTTPVLYNVHYWAIINQWGAQQILTQSNILYRAAVAKRLPRSPPTKANRVQPPAGSPGFLQVGIVPDDAVGQRVFSGISRFPPPFHSGAGPYSPQSSASALMTSLFRAAQNLFTSLSLPNKFFKYTVVKHQFIYFSNSSRSRQRKVFTCQQCANQRLLSHSPPWSPANKEPSANSFETNPASFPHWLLPRCEVTPFLGELCVIGTHDCQVVIYWRRVTRGVSYKVWSNDKRIAKHKPTAQAASGKVRIYDGVVEICSKAAVHPARVSQLTGKCRNQCRHLIIPDFAVEKLLSINASDAEILRTLLYLHTNLHLASSTVGDWTISVVISRCSEAPHTQLTSVVILCEEIWAALNVEVLRAGEDEAGMKGRGADGRSPRKPRRPAASSGTIPTCENPKVWLTLLESAVWPALGEALAVKVIEDTRAALGSQSRKRSRRLPWTAIDCPSRSRALTRLCSPTVAQIGLAYRAEARPPIAVLTVERCSDAGRRRHNPRQGSDWLMLDASRRNALLWKPLIRGLPPALNLKSCCTRRKFVGVSFANQRVVTGAAVVHWLDFSPPTESNRREDDGGRGEEEEEKKWRVEREVRALSEKSSAREAGVSRRVARQYDNSMENTRILRRVVPEFYLPEFDSPHLVTLVLHHAPRKLAARTGSGLWLPVREPPTRPPFGYGGGGEGKREQLWLHHSLARPVAMRDNGEVKAPMGREREREREISLPSPGVQVLERASRHASRVDKLKGRYTIEKTLTFDFTFAFRHVVSYGAWHNGTVTVEGDDWASVLQEMSHTAWTNGLSYILSQNESANSSVQPASRTFHCLILAVTDFPTARRSFFYRSEHQLQLNSTPSPEACSNIHSGASYHLEEQLGSAGRVCNSTPIIDLPPPSLSYNDSLSSSLTRARRAKSWCVELEFAVGISGGSAFVFVTTLCLNTQNTFYVNNLYQRRGSSERAEEDIRKEKELVTGRSSAIFLTEVPCGGMEEPVTGPGGCPVSPPSSSGSGTKPVRKRKGREDKLKDETSRSAQSGVATISCQDCGQSLKDARKRVYKTSLEKGRENDHSTSIYFRAPLRASPAPTVFSPPTGANIAQHAPDSTKLPAWLHRFFFFYPFLSEKRGCYKGHAGTLYKSAIASTRRARSAACTCSLAKISFSVRAHEDNSPRSTSTEYRVSEHETLDRYNSTGEEKGIERVFIHEIRVIYCPSAGGLRPPPTCARLPRVDGREARGEIRDRYCWKVVRGVSNKLWSDRSETAWYVRIKYNSSLKSGWTSVGTPLPRSRSEAAIRAAMKPSTLRVRFLYPYPRVVSGVVWTNRTMVSSNTDKRTGVLAVVDIGDSLLICREFQALKIAHFIVNNPIELCSAVPAAGIDGGLNARTRTYSPVKANWGNWPLWTCSNLFAVISNFSETFLKFYFQESGALSFWCKFLYLVPGKPGSRTSGRLQALRRSSVLECSARPLPARFYPRRRLQPYTVLFGALPRGVNNHEGTPLHEVGRSDSRPQTRACRQTGSPPSTSCCIPYKPASTWGRGGVVDRLLNLSLPPPLLTKQNPVEVRAGRCR